MPGVTVTGVTDPKPERDMDERVSLPDDAEKVLRALVEVDPDDEPQGDQEDGSVG